ncbi:longitudinals lacking protein, isoforms H/M/V isoform X1 [Ischnura elegans]|uniref:longitudinals lacking protein, isoforms H/M/V isoform X1 n=1 Tax=Ischnura elegans TaxID=197161 RepID=UPI001ED86875|nr:longitudinals lacking protein, isoforms H/M/V isoform X1 [Ischnura elegans]
MGSEQQFCLRWNNHQSTLISVFDTLLESETLVDVTLAAEGQYLKAHKVVLSACSQYFQELLCHHLEKHPIIILKDVTFQELKALIDYMYRGEVNVSQEQLSALIKTAESLKIKGLADGGDRRPDRKSVPQLSPPLPPVLGPALSGNLSLDNRSMGAGEYATNSPLQHGPREGSISPVSRKRKRIRRRSGEGVAGGGAHEGEVGGGSEQASSSASTLSVPNIPATITPVNSGSRTTPGDGDGGDDEGVAGSKLDGGQEDGVQGPASSKQTKSEPGTSLQSHSRTPLLEPKSEYREEDDDDGEADEDSMDNVVALDEDVMDMEGSRDDGLDQKAGPSHGAEVSGQGSGFAPWHMMPDRSGDDIFIPSQESAAQRESQEEQWFPFPRTALAPSPTPPTTSSASTTTSLVPYTSSVVATHSSPHPPASPTYPSPHHQLHHHSLAPSPTWAVSPRHHPLGPQRPTPGGKQVRRRVVVALLPPDEEEEAPNAPLPHHLFPAPHHHNPHRHLTGHHHHPGGLFPPLPPSYVTTSHATASAATTNTTSSSSTSPPTSKSYACPRCDRRYSVSYTLERHLRYECGVAKQFACPVCLRRFSRRDVLRAHQRKAGHHHHQHHRHHLVPSPTSAASRAVEEAASAVVELPAEVVGSLFSGK